MEAKLFLFITLLTIGLLGTLVLRKIGSLSPPPGLMFNDQGCHLVGVGVGMKGSEDLALGKHGLLLITSGDLHNTFNHGAASAAPGGIYVLDMRPGGNTEPRRIELESFPEGRRFQGHGLDVSNTTDRVYCVSHNGDHSSVDVFQISYHLKCVDSIPWDCVPVSLTFLKSVRSNLFPNYGINDVVEAEENQIYVTQWQPFSFPIRGRHHPVTWVEKIQGMSGLPMVLLDIKMTHVFHCTWSDDSEPTCETASDHVFLGANGLTIDRERTMVYVNDPASKMITAMQRDRKTGQLRVESEIVLPVAADNIEYDDEADTIIIATIPDLMSASKKGKGEDILVPGGLSVAHKTDEGGWEIKDVLNHDGSKLNQISAAARLGDRVVLGSPFSEGVLVCKMV